MQCTLAQCLIVGTLVAKGRGVEMGASKELPLLFLEWEQNDAGRFLLTMQRIDAATTALDRLQPVPFLI